jgi:hypothetical protein
MSTMTVNVEVATGRYLYALVSAAAARPRYDSVGIDGGTVYSLRHGQVAAVISDVPNRRIRPERRHLTAHQQVLQRLLAETTPLPASFGTIADGCEGIHTILSENQAAFHGQLQRLAGTVEMGLKMFWDVPNIFTYFVSTHSELGALRDRVFRGGRDPSVDEKIELGALFERLLREDRARHGEKVVAMLQGCCREVRENDARSEREVMNLACLVGRRSQQQFEEGVFEAAKLFDQNYALDFSGPWPPHSFAQVEVGVE